NRETWAVHLHLTNDEYASEAVLRDIEEHLDERRRAATTAGTWPGSAVHHAADAVCDFFDRWIEQFIDDSDAHGVALILRDVGSVWRVDWHEVAEALTAET